jgi:TIR domain-containing protein
MISAFISYSHRDEEYRNELEVHLAMLTREGIVSVWHDRRITAGRDVNNAINAQIDTAQVILFLVSPYFLASNYCYELEMERALERHRSGLARVIPIIINPCEWQRTSFGNLRATPPDGRPVTKFPNVHDAYQAVVTDIRAAIEELGLTPQPQAAGSVADLNSTTAAWPEAPRSSNLRLNRRFTEHDQDRFRDDAFKYIANFFEASLDELQARNADIQNRFRRVDADHFTAAIYRLGNREAACRVWIGGGYARGILYSTDDNGNDNSYNECLSVVNDGQMLLLEPLMGMLRGVQGQRQFSHQGAAEYLWSSFISPLQ